MMHVYSNAINHKASVVEMNSSTESKYKVSNVQCILTLHSKTNSKELTFLICVCEYRYELMSYIMRRYIKYF